MCVTTLELGGQLSYRFVDRIDGTQVMDRKKKKKKMLWKNAKFQRVTKLIDKRNFIYVCKNAKNSLFLFFFFSYITEFFS